MCRFVAPTISLRNGRFQETTHSDLRDALVDWDASARRLVVHFHGGLVKRQAGQGIAARLQPLYESAGGFPLFFVWQSGLGETIVHNLADVAGERIFKRLLARVLQFTVGKVREARAGTRGMTVDLPDLVGVYDAFAAGDGEPYADLPEEVAPLSASQEQQFLAVLRADQVIQTESAAIAAALREGDGEGPPGADRGAVARATTTTKMSPQVLAEIEAELGPGMGTGERSVVATARIVKGAAMTIKRVLVRLHAGRGHGVYATAVEELLRELYLTNAGRLVWEQMKQDTADAFGADAELCGGTALLQGLAAREPGAAPVLVGHSTGAVYICNFLAHADATLPKGHRFDVVMLAPACDFQLMDRTFTRHGERIARLRIFCMKDEHERQDRLLPAIYPRSLLYFVSGALESAPDWPLLGMERFYADGPPFAEAGFPEIDRVRSEIASRPDSAVWSIAAGGPGLASDAVRHGDFDDDPTTLESIRDFISAA